MSLLENWCTGEGLDASHALVVKHVPIETTVTHIEETLMTIKVLGRVRVRGRMFNPQLQSLMVLCECSERVNIKTIPMDVPSIEGGELWTLHGPADEEFNPEKKQTDHLSQDGSASTEDAAAPDMLSSEAMSGNSAESIIRAVGDLLAKTMKPAQESNVFRRLRTYSGISPTPPGEESLETWMEQARLMRGGITPNQRDRARVEQLLRGTTESEIMLLQLRLRERKRNPPSFLTLLNEIREEEFQQAVRKKSCR
uniref:Uncharacterized protein n=1 Tax=Fundulus heteroclitus TaxID=8078 RepID=A0A3Q2TLV7_FUNHE